MTNYADRVQLSWAGPRARWGSTGGSLLLVLASFAGGLAMLFLVLEQRPDGWWRTVDVAVGALACTALLLRNRIPVAVGLGLAVAATFVATAGVANYVALFAVARRCRMEIAFLVALADIAAGFGFWLLYPANAAVSLTVAVNAAIALAVVAWGALQQTQQDLVEVYRDRAARIERERALRAERIRQTERERIARDMHDSVAHYISLIAMYAGGLEVAGAGAQDVGPTAATIRSAATSALSELRSVIGMLRDGTLAVPQDPGTAQDLDGLIAQARHAGQLVVAHVDNTCADPDDPVAGDVYRIVREGLTNARKHAPDSLVTVEVRRRDEAVMVSVTNPVDDDAPVAPGSRTGLLGLAEHVTEAGGGLEHGVVGRPDGQGEFRLCGRLPLR